jgi:hypothetical protein
VVNKITELIEKKKNKNDPVEGDFV